MNKTIVDWVSPPRWKEGCSGCRCAPPVWPQGWLTVDDGRVWCPDCVSDRSEND